MHLISGPRLPFTATYLGAIVLTIYFAIGVSSATPAFSRAELILAAVALHAPHLVVVHHSACCIGVVSRQLFPNGKHGVEVRCSSGWRKSGSLDERLSRLRKCPDIITHHPPCPSESALPDKRVVSCNPISCDIRDCQHGIPSLVGACSYVRRALALAFSSTQSPPLAILLLVILTDIPHSIYN